LEFEYDGDAALRGHFQVFFDVGRIGFRKALEDPDHWFHRFEFIARLPQDPGAPPTMQSRWLPLGLVAGVRSAKCEVSGERFKHRSQYDDITVVTVRRGS
jgi:hypothetical protein